MATRFYLPSDGAAAAAPAFGSAWTYVDYARRRPLPLAKTNTPISYMTATEYADVPVNFLARQFVSDETFPAAATIGTGTLSAILFGRQSTSTSDFYLQVVIRVVSGDGLTERGTLYAGATANAVSTTPGDQNQKFNTANETRIWNSIPLSPVSVQAGDRLVVEIGARSCNTFFPDRTFYAYFGDPSATADYALTAGLTAELCPWVEFSEDLFAPVEPPISGAVSLHAPTPAVSLTGTVEPPAITGSVTLDAPVPTLALAGTVTPPAITGSLAIGAPAPELALTGGSVAADITGSLLLNAPVPTLAVTGSSHAPTITGSLALAAPLPALALTGAYAGPVFTDSDLTYSSDAYGYDGVARVRYDPPIVESPKVRRTKIKRVHQSLPAPTLVDGRPT